MITETIWLPAFPFPLYAKRATWLGIGGNAPRAATGRLGWRCANRAASLPSFGMSWHRAAGISGSYSVGASASAARYALPTGFDAAIPRGSASSISSGFNRTGTISRCSGTRFVIRVPGRIGWTSSIRGAAALGVLRNGWFWRRHSLRVYCKRMSTLLVGRFTKGTGAELDIDPPESIVR